MTLPFSDKQLEFISKSTAKWNLAHGSVRSGKTVCTLFRFMHAASTCPDSQIYMVGHSTDTIYRNAIRLLFESPQFAIHRPFCTWFGGSKNELKFRDKVIKILGASNHGALGQFQGNTMSLVYCDEMTLYPIPIIDMIDTRLSNPHSMGFASMNPSYPSHKLKEWIDKADSGDKNYYALQFTLDDNPYVGEDYKARLRESLSGVFYRRNYLGHWCLAEGSVFDFFDKRLHTASRPPTSADYWLAGIDYGMSNAFACVLVGVSTGNVYGKPKAMWVEKEYFWDPKKTYKQKTNTEFRDDLIHFFDGYSIKNIYIDPSAEAFELELKRAGMHVVHANNDVFNGIQMMTSSIRDGRVVVLDNCTNLIREIESYTWDSKKSEKGEDAPIKVNDHALDALRYVIASHKISSFDAEKTVQNTQDYMRYRFDPGRRKG